MKGQNRIIIALPKHDNLAQEGVCACICVGVLYVLYLFPGLICVLADPTC